MASAGKEVLMDVPGGPDRVWRSMKELAAAYARLPAPPPTEQVERDVHRVMTEALGREIDRRLVTFYVRELEQLMLDERARRTIRGEIITEGDGAESSKAR